MIIVQTPLRVSFFGGGTDFRSFFESEGGCVLTTAIDKYIFVTIKKRFDQRVRVGYTKTELVENLSEIRHELIREALCKVGIRQGIEITTMGDIPSAGSGLGSSSTVTVGAFELTFFSASVTVSCFTAILAVPASWCIVSSTLGNVDNGLGTIGLFRPISRPFYGGFAGVLRRSCSGPEKGLRGSR